MPENTSGNHFEQLDQLRRDFDHWNTHLCMTALRFRKQSPALTDVADFVQATLALAKVCEHELSEHSPLDVLFWARNKLRQEYFRGNHGDVFDAYCKREKAKLEQSIQRYCDHVGNGKVVALM